MSEPTPFQADLDLLLQEIAVLEKDNLTLQNTLQDKDNILLAKEESLTGKDARIQEQAALIAKLTRMLYGAKRERFEQNNPIQLGLDFGTISPQEIAAIEVLLQKTKERIKKSETEIAKKPHPGRKPLPGNLAVVEITIEPTEDVTGMVKVGAEVSETLEYKRAAYYIQRVSRPKYAPISKEGSFVIAPMPESAFPKCTIGTSLVAQILTDKYVDHLPLYRQEQRFKREGIELASSTIADSVKMGLERLGILYGYVKQNLLAKNYLQVDETTLKVFDHNKKGTSHLGYFWVYYDPGSKNAFFKYEPGRGAKYPEEILHNFKGYLQTDGYAGYGNLGRNPDITPVACWAHARRKFEEALTNHKTLAGVAMGLIQNLYQIERQARDEKLTPEARKALRLDEALPTYVLLGKWIAAQMNTTLPKSVIGKALRYAFERWDELGNYLHDGNLEIDNNLVENAIRPIALGRKNWLAAGNHEAAQRAAIIYTFMSMCKNHQIDPYRWIKYVLENIMTTKPSQYPNLLPQNIKYNPDF